MCAIFGMIGKTNRELLRKVSKIQIYRGPDNQGFFESVDYFCNALQDRVFKKHSLR